MDITTDTDKYVQTHTDRDTKIQRYWCKTQDTHTHTHTQTHTDTHTVFLLFLFTLSVPYSPLNLDFFISDSHFITFRIRTELFFFFFVFTFSFGVVGYVATFFTITTGKKGSVN